VVGRQSVAGIGLEPDQRRDQPPVGQQALAQLLGDRAQTLPRLRAPCGRIDPPGQRRQQIDDVLDGGGLRGAVLVAVGQVVIADLVDQREIVDRANAVGNRRRRIAPGIDRLAASLQPIDRIPVEERRMMRGDARIDDRPGDLLAGDLEQPRGGVGLDRGERLALP
jgi:hypothetical protein